MRNRIITTSSASLILGQLAVSSIYAQDTAEAVDATQNTSLFGLLQQGGWAMFPLGLTALFMFFQSAGLQRFCWRCSRLIHVDCTVVPAMLAGVFLVYLTARTWTSGVASATFASQVARAMRGGVRLLLAHEADAERERTREKEVARCV